MLDYVSFETKVENIESYSNCREEIEYCHYNVSVLEERELLYD